MILALVIADVYILNFVMDYTYKQRYMDMLTRANIAASFVGDNGYDDRYQLNALAASEQDARVIYFDKDAKVVFDNAQSGNLHGKIMSDPQALMALSGENVTDKLEQGEDLYLIAAVPVTRNAETIGGVYVKSQANDITEYYSHVRNSLLILSGAVCLLLGVFSLLMARAFTAPISNLTSKIKEMSENDSREPVELSGNNEINELVSAFNKMVEKIEDVEVRRQEFVSNASHELKTPLSSIKLICDSILQTPDVDRNTINEFLVDMNAEVDRLTRIINKLLSLTKLDVSADEKEVLELTTFNIKTLAEDIVRALTPLAKKKHIKIQTLFVDDVFIRTDADKIWEAIYNILDNSIKYTQNCGRVYMELYRDDKNVVITITDNGIGMAEEEIDKIFDRFYRVDKARARETGGTGLGLSIALSAVELNGGYIEVESYEEVGSLFRIVLPVETEL